MDDLARFYSMMAFGNTWHFERHANLVSYLRLVGPKSVRLPKLKEVTLSHLGSLTRKLSEKYDVKIAKKKDITY